MSNVNLEELFFSIHDAVSHSNQTMREQYLEQLKDYFDENGEPVSIEMDMPFPGNTGIEYRKIKVPKLTLVPLSMMNVKEIEIDFNVALSQLPQTYPEENGDGNQEEKDSSPNLKRKLFQKKKPELKVNVQPTGTASENQAHIHIRMEGSDPPEGVLKINDYLLKGLP